MGAICKQEKKNHLDEDEKDIQKLMESLSYDSYLLDTEIIKQQKILPLFKHIQKLHQSKIDPHLSEIQQRQIKTILNKLEVLVDNYYVPSGYRKRSEKLVQLQLNEIIIICHFLIEDIKVNKQPQWITIYCSQQTEELEKQFHMRVVRNKNKSTPIINLINLIIECIKSECPWLQESYTNETVISKQAERSNQLQAMYNIYQ